MRIGQQHSEPINTNANANRRRQSIFKRMNIFSIIVMSLCITSSTRINLLLKTSSLIKWIIKLIKAIANFHTGNKKFKTSCKSRILFITFCKWRNFNGKFGDKCWLNQLMFNNFFKQCI